MSKGFESAGYQIVAGVDSWGPALEVYKNNFSHPVLDMDLGDPASLEVIKELAPDLIVGGPPCQDFSSAGPNNVASKRANLTISYVDIICAVKPEFFVLENVPRIRYSEVFKEAEALLRRSGYGLTIKILNAAYCGVPQSRKRLFVIGHRGGEDDFLQQELQNNLSEKPLTLREHLGKQLDVDYYFRIPTNYQRKAIFSVDEPSVTIRGIDRPIPKTYQRHPDDPVPIGDNVRALTVLERSYVQTFPETFQFSGTKTNLNQMIGNAVPVKMAEHVAKAIFRYKSDIESGRAQKAAQA
ncbi:MAG TPA: DNA (cytosine-5-)-methyltransferase [Porticoccus sp.]|nr:DNA (cytosine-5-)-methyltransferase [Porticoccus sp.]